MPGQLSFSLGTFHWFLVPLTVISVFHPVVFHPTKFFSHIFISPLAFFFWPVLAVPGQIHVRKAVLFMYKQQKKDFYMSVILVC